MIAAVRPARAAGADVVLATGTAPVSVLLVDDNPSKRVAIKAILLPLGFSIIEAESGVAALRRLLEQDFAVILLDVCMPITDGFETAALIRQRRESEMTPIIFITGHSGDEIGTQRYAQGAIDFIFAPVPPDELRAKVLAFANIYSRAQELAAQARSVQSSADQLRLLTDAAPVGIFQTDVDNRYIYTNPQWSEITGLPAADAVGQSWDMILGADARAALLTRLSDGAGPTADLGERFELEVPGSETRVVLLTSRAIPDGAGGVSGWVGTLADVTAEAAAGAAMQSARDDALAAGAKQKQFAASASHELRTPTASILGFVEEVLANNAVSDEDRGFLEIVYRNAQRLSQLIDDLLVLGQAEGGDSMNLEATQLSPLVERVIAIFSSVALRAGIELSVEHDPEVSPAFVDPLRLEQALTNLIGNALKFTPRGGAVKVSVTGNSEVVEVSVNDTGPGINLTDIDRIFDRFYRTKNALENSVKGSGLGLAIAKTMIEAQNGQLRVASTPGAGATFTITVPTAVLQLQGVA